MQREAVDELRQARVGQVIDRVKLRFVQDHQGGARREEALLLLKKIADALDSSVESDRVKIELERAVRKFKLKETPEKAVDNFDKFVEMLEQIKYTDILASESAF
jgi:DNA-binding PadR family transcriptional regulator